MKILSLFIHPQVVPNLYEFLSSVKKLFWRMLFTSIFFSYYESQWLPSFISPNVNVTWCFRNDPNMLIWCPINIPIVLPCWKQLLIIFVETI